MRPFYINHTVIFLVAAIIAVFSVLLAALGVNTGQPGIVLGGCAVVHVATVFARSVFTR